MKLIRTFSLTKSQAYDRLKRFYVIDKHRTAKEGRVSRDA
jgi:hypothetical protein